MGPASPLRPRLALHIRAMLKHLRMIDRVVALGFATESGRPVDVLASTGMCGRGHVVGLQLTTAGRGDPAEPDRVRPEMVGRWR